MGKQTGLGDNLYVSGFNISGDVGSLGRIGGGPAPLEVTAIDKSAFERIGGLRDGSIEFVSFFNDTAGQVHDALSALPRTDVILTYCRGTEAGSPAACMVAKQINYDYTRADDGSLTANTQAQANGYGIEWGRQLTSGVDQDTSAGNGDSLDLGTGSTNFGLQAYLQVFSFTGTSVTFKLQQSSDDGDSDAFADVTSGAFSSFNAPGAQRISTASNQTVERYLRVVSTGTFSEVSYSIVVMRNKVAKVF